MRSAKRAKLIPTLTVVFGLVLDSLGCRHEPEPHSQRASAQPKVTAGEGPTSFKALVATSEPATMLTTGSSAYAATLTLDGDVSYLLTPNAAYRLAHGNPAERRSLELGESPVLKGNELLYWADGTFNHVPIHQGKPSILAAVARKPRRVVTSGDDFAWLGASEEGRFTIQTLDGSKARVIHAPSGDIKAMAMQNKQVYFVERESRAGWRIGAVSLTSGATLHTPMKSGRTPAMLAVAGDVFYYDGPSFTIRRVSSDLKSEQVIARNVICSPIAVAVHVYCAGPAGLLELGLDGTVRRALRLSRKGAITAITATSNHLTWLLDTGPDQLAVETMALTPAR